MRKFSVAVSGTPGTGKSYFAQKLAAAVPSSFIVEVNDVAKVQNLFIGVDEYGTKIVDTKALGAAVRAELRKGFAAGASLAIIVGHLVPYIGMHFDMAVVMRCSLRVLLKRLIARDYPKPKISDNLLCEAMDCVGTDMIGKAKETYEAATVADSKVLIAYISTIASGRQSIKPKLKEINLMGELYSMIKKGEFEFGAIP